MADIRISSSTATNYLQNLKVSTRQDHQPLRDATAESTRVSISDAGKRAASVDAAKTATPVAGIKDLRELVSQYDFNNITPRQLGQLANELYSRGELTAEETANLVGTELDTEPPRDPNEPIDMQAHFEFMRSAVAEAGKNDSTLNWAVQNRELAVQTLANLMSFASDTRDHIHS